VNAPVPKRARAGTPDELYWQHRANAFVLQALESIRQSASRWTTAMAGITGAFGIVALVKGPGDLAKIGDPTLALIAPIAVLASVAFAGAAVYAANTAQGVPRHIERLTADEFRKNYLKEIHDSVGWLAWSKGLAGAALLSMAVAVGITWFGTAPAPATRVLLTRESGRLCADLVAQSDGWIAVRMQTNGPAIVIPAQDLRPPSATTCP